MIRKLKILIDNYRLSKEYKKMLKDNSIKPLTKYSHLNVIDI